MKLKKIFFTALLFSISLNLFSKSTIREISIGIFQLKFAYYVPITEKSILGINASGGLYGRNMTPLTEITPTYKHYFTPKKNGTLFITSEFYLQQIFQKTEQSKFGTTTLGLGAGIGYRVYLGENKRIYLSPSLSLRLPLYRQGGNNYTFNNLSRISFYRTTMNSISIGYRF